MEAKMEWWQSAVFYQIYPRSFADGNGDGMGDFAGMFAKLDYLQDLGINAVWLSPHYPSPFVDCGYDISDYEGVAAEYGTLQDFKRFLDGLHERGMFLILDLVLNHTSDQHPWFRESRSSLENPKRDWYIWKKGKDGQPPTNWSSTFGGSAWQLDDQTGEYYYHFFFKEQPDLNWKNPAVKKAMFDSVRFWLGMGVDGFRLDAVGTIFEDERYPDQPEALTHDDLIRQEMAARNAEELAQSTATWERMFQYQYDLPGVHELMHELRQVVDEYPHRVLVGETDDIAFYGNGSDELHLVFNFPLMKVPQLSAAHVRANQADRAAHLPEGAWPCNTLGNHDVSRMYSHYGDGVHNALQARLHLTLLLTLRGTPFLYYGEEIGMTDYLLNDARLFRDPLSFNYLRILKQSADTGEKEAIAIAAEKGRDRCRTPFQWFAEANAGFCPKDVQPWLPVNPNYRAGVNAADEQNDPDSLWRYYQKLLHYRQGSKALMLGKYHEISGLPEEMVGFTRTYAPETLIVLLNFSAKSQHFLRSYLPMEPLRATFTSTDGVFSEQGEDVTVNPFGSVIFSVAKT